MKMFKAYGRKKRIKTTLIITFILATISYITFVYFSKSSQSVVIAKVGSTDIYLNEIEKVYRDSLGLDKNNTKLSKVNQSIVKSLAQEIYTRKIMLEDAKKEGVHRDKLIKERVNNYANKLIIEKYVSNKIAKESTPEKIKQYYDRIVKESKGQNEFKVDLIRLDNESTAKIIYNKLSATKKLSKKRFNYFKNKYSTEKGYESRYIQEKNMPIKLEDKEELYRTKAGSMYIIYAVTDKRKVVIPEFDEEQKSIIRYKIYQDVTSKIFKKALKNKKIVVYGAQK